MKSVISGRARRKKIPLLSKDLTAYCQYTLKAFTAFNSVLFESLDGELFDLILDPLPSTTHCDDLRALLKSRLAAYF